MITALFLTEPELHLLTGYSRKSMQIDWLRQNGIPFRVNATGHPVVTCAAIEQRAVAPVVPVPARPTWTPRVIGA